MSIENHQSTPSIYPCPSCFLLISDDWNACPYCGKTVSDFPSRKWSVNSTDEGYCSQCGQHVAADTIHCPHCEADPCELPADFCTACGSSLAEDWRACPYCGEPTESAPDEDNGIWPFEFPCPRCHRLVRNDDRTCPHCSERLFYE